MSENWSFDHKAIEKKWQKIWLEKDLYRTPEIDKSKRKKYILDMFPYPSGSGLHVGHILGYTGSDIISRTARKQDFQVLHPIGWDAFGLPAENYAIKTGTHPAKSTAKNITEFKRQISGVGLSYDWNREINTSDPDYYKWTQWFFCLLYKRGLAYRKEGLVNWCPSCQTVLANEQVVNGECERCGSKVEQKQLKQWFFKITEYAQRLLDDLDSLDWPERIKTAQRNWIGRSEGAQITFKIEDQTEYIEVFTTRPDTIPGATFLVLAPEHPLVDLIVTSNHQAAVEKYKSETNKKSELERTFLDRDKTGVFTGAYAINPYTKEPIPVWIADYVLSTYGTGAIMAVPAHDERDYEFATSFGLPIIQVIDSQNSPLPYTDKGKLIVEGELKGKNYEEAVDIIIRKTKGERKVIFRLRDWLVSRQRFWGSPIPVSYDEDGNEYLVDEADLPIKLPDNIEILPTGQSPLALANDWRYYKDAQTGKQMTREADTLDTFVCSSWYYLRFVNPNLQTEAFNKDDVNNWMPVDLYIGGAEHAVMHLLYARFFTKVLYDAGYINFNEPFTKLMNQGLILGPDHNKMSKSKGNVINPDDVVSEYGGDTLRLYEMFMAPFEVEKPWSTKGILGIRRFLDKVWRLNTKVSDVEPTHNELVVLHRTIKKVTEDIALCKFNTAVSAMMEAVNAFSNQESLNRQTYLTLLNILNPFAPHITDELWQINGADNICTATSWPTFNETYLVETKVQYVVQINGKVRDNFEVDTNIPQAEVLNMAKASEKVQKYITGKTIVKEIFIPNKLISMVVKD